jgi:hypothetical protein
MVKHYPPAAPWPARCPSTMACSSASSSASTGSRSSADVSASFSQWLVPVPLRICLPVASTLPVASAKRERAHRCHRQARTSQPTLATARTQQAVRVAQKSCSAVVRRVARRARPQACLGACRGWARKWRVRCSKRRSRDGRSESSGQRHLVQRGHRAHICRGCFRRPASSPAVGPEPA